MFHNLMSSHRREQRNQLERQRRHDWRQHHQAHRHQHRSDHEIDDQNLLQRREDAHRKIFWLLRRFLARHIHEQPQILFATFFSMNPRRGPEARSDASFNDLVGDQRLEPDVVKRA
jgi:hypothetical protein